MRHAKISEAPWMIVGDSGVRFSPWQGISTVRCRAVSRPLGPPPVSPVLVAERGACERSSPAGHGWPAQLAAGRRSACKPRCLRPVAPRGWRPTRRASAAPAWRHEARCFGRGLTYDHPWRAEFLCRARTVLWRPRSGGAAGGSQGEDCRIGLIPTADQPKVDRPITAGAETAGSRSSREAAGCRIPYGASGCVP